MAKDPAAITAIKNKLNPTACWKDASLKAAVQLKWTMFLTDARLRDQALEHREGFRNEDLEMQVFNAVQGDSFSFLLRVLSQFGSSQDTATQLLAGTSSSSSADNNDTKPSVVPDFQVCLLHEVELLLRSLLTHAPAELRKIKHKQEDQFRPRADRHGRGSLRPSDVANERTTQPRNDIATLFQLVGQLYTLLPEDTAIQFWGGVPNKEAPAHYEIIESERGKLPSFLRWAIEVREPELIISVFEMLAGLATGVACSECAYNFMATGAMDVVHGGGTGMMSRYEIAAAFTWGSIFGELESWAALGSNHRSGHGATPPQLPIAPGDVLLGLSFLKVLTAVATYSVQARVAIFSPPTIQSRQLHRFVDSPRRSFGAEGCFIRDVVCILPARRWNAWRRNLQKRVGSDGTPRGHQRAGIRRGFQRRGGRTGGGRSRISSVPRDDTFLGAACHLDPHTQTSPSQESSDGARTHKHYSRVTRRALQKSWNRAIRRLRGGQRPCKSSPTRIPRFCGFVEDGGIRAMLSGAMFGELRS